LRIASSGIWANLQLVLIGFVGMGKEVGGLGGSEWIMRGGFEKLGEGVKVVDVKKVCSHSQDGVRTWADKGGECRIHLFSNYYHPRP